MKLQANKIKIVLVEDHEVVRKGFIRILEDQPNIKIVGEAANGKELFKILPELSPDIILLDVEMPVMNGGEALIEINKMYATIKTVILSSHIGDLFVKEFLAKGARAYLYKNCSIEELIETINTVYNEGYYLTKSSKDFIVKQELQKIQLDSTFSQRSLTEKETAVLKLICEGKANKQMADILKIDINTINYHKRNIFNKTNLKSVGPLVKYALKNGYTDL